MADTFTSTDSQLPSQHSGFWLYQLAGWSLYSALQLMLVASENNLTAPRIAAVILLVLLAASGSLALRWCYRRWRRISLPTVRWLIQLTALSATIAAAVDVAYYAGLYPLSYIPALHGLFDQQPLGAQFVFLLPVYLFWSALYLSLSRQHDLQHIHHSKQLLELRLQEARLQNLLAQINPHFMFNALNNIRGLILEDTAAARDMLSHFAQMMRYQLTSEGAALVPLQQELAVAKDYLALQKIHFESRLTVEWQLDPACDSLMVPRFTLQLLLENAIKHGISRSRQGRLKIIVCMHAETRWSISIANSGKLQPAVRSEDNALSGLTNLRQRLQFSFGNSAAFSLQQQQDWVVAHILFAPAGSPAILPVLEPT